MKTIIEADLLNTIDKKIIKFLKRRCKNYKEYKIVKIIKFDNKIKITDKDNNILEYFFENELI